MVDHLACGDLDGDCDVGAYGVVHEEAFQDGYVEAYQDENEDWAWRKEAFVPFLQR